MSRYALLSLRIGLGLVFLLFAFDKIINPASAATPVSGTILTDTIWALANSPYVVGEVYINPGITLRIEPGVAVKFKMPSSAIFSNGNFLAEGTSDNPIYFTSFKNDAVGGDTNGDDRATQPAPGDWDKIYFVSGQANLNNIILDYAGRFAPSAGIYSQAKLIIANSNIRNNLGLGIYQAGGDTAITASEIYNQNIGFYLYQGSARISRSSIHDNATYGAYSAFGHLVEAALNFWGHASGPYHPSLNPSGQGNRVSSGINFIPWLEQDPLREQQNQSPAISALNQYKSDGQTSILEGGIMTESSQDNPYNSLVVFQAVLNDPDNDTVKLQAEIKEFNQPFDGTDIIESGFVTSGSVATATRRGLVEGRYHWQARAMDDKGNASAWQEFSAAGNTDFEVKLVPLYTQVRSPYPSFQETESWYDKDYAKGGIGTYPCAKGSRATIARCGCAITSVVMIARYYDVLETQGKDVNPGEINNWLRDNNGYENGNINWIAAAKYTHWRIKYEKTNENRNNLALLEEKLNNNQPVIAKANRGRGGVNSQHFFVIDNKLASTYGVKDPAWYNTRALNEITNSADKIRGYENGFDGLRIYKKGDGIAQSAITVALGSPAELLIIDSQGRKLGKDANGVEYNEIPDASYFEDGFDDPAEENPLPQERNKLIQILEPIDGQYQLQVIGTGEGGYSLESSFFDTQGNTNQQEFQSETAPGYTAQYNFSFDSSNSASTTIQLFDETPPEAEIYFNPEIQELAIKGTDNTTVNPIVSVIDNEKEKMYQIQDEAGNITKLFFDKIKQEGKEIKAELKAIQYNNNELIKIEAELKYEWSLDKDGVIKEIEQKIEAEDQFKIKANYHHKKNETEIKIEKDEEEVRQTISGLVIIKLITKSGILVFNY